MPAPTKKCALTLLCLTTISNASLPTLPIPPSSSTSINHMIAPLLAFGRGYKTATINLNYIRKNNAPVIPYLLKALSAGLISVFGLGFLGEEPSYSELTFYASTFVLGALMGARSSNFDRQLTTTQHKLLTSQQDLVTSQQDLVTSHYEHIITQGKLLIAQRKLNTLNAYFEESERNLASCQNGLPSTVIESSEQSEYEETICTICQYPLLESEYFLIKLKCGDLFHQPCINSWVTHKASCPSCRTCLIETSGRITKSPHRVLNQDHENTL